MSEDIRKDVRQLQELQADLEEVVSSLVSETGGTLSNLSVMQLLNWNYNRLIEAVRKVKEVSAEVSDEEGSED